MKKLFGKGKKDKKEEDHPPAPAPVAAAKEPPKEKKEKKEKGPVDTEGDGVLFSRTAQQTVGKEDFELLTVIGKGSFGKVMQVRKKDDGKIYAMKVLRKDNIIAKKQVAHTKAEKHILEKVSHPFIIKLNYAFQTEGKLYLILDYVNGGELFWHLKNSGRFDEDRVRFYTAEIVSALGHLHELGVVYRDLKPENLLIDTEGHICITDFGLSKEIDNEEGTNTFCGTPEYLAPEILAGNHHHNTAVDWWSLGILTYEMLTGLPPFYSKNMNIMYQKIMTAELSFPPYINDETQSLLRGLLTRDVPKRLGSNGVGEIKSHPYFSSINWNKLEKREVPAPWTPDVAGTADTSQIDPMFTSEKAEDSMVDTGFVEATGGDAHFEGFTYVNPDALEG